MYMLLLCAGEIDGDGIRQDETVDFILPISLFFLHIVSFVSAFRGCFPLHYWYYRHHRAWLSCSSNRTASATFFVGDRERMIMVIRRTHSALDYTTEDLVKRTELLTESGGSLLQEGRVFILERRVQADLI